MFTGCPEYFSAEGTHSEYSWNIACRLGSEFAKLRALRALRAYVLYVRTCL